MDTATKILIVGGLACLAASFVFGTVLAGRRRTEPASAMRQLLVLHQTAVMQGTMLLALSLAVALSDLSTGIETIAASLLVGGAVFNTLGNHLNYSGRVEDQFAGKSSGLRLNSINSMLAIPGLLILIVGVVVGL